MRDHGLADNPCVGLPRTQIAQNPAASLVAR